MRHTKTFKYALLASLTLTFAVPQPAEASWLSSLKKKVVATLPKPVQKAVAVKDKVVASKFKAVVKAHEEGTKFGVRTTRFAVDHAGDAARLGLAAGAAPVVLGTAGAVAGGAVGTAGALAGGVVGTAGAIAGGAVGTAGAIAGGAVGTAGAVAGGTIGTVGAVTAPAVIGTTSVAAPVVLGTAGAIGTAGVATAGSMASAVMLAPNVDGGGGMGHHLAMRDETRGHERLYDTASITDGGSDGIVGTGVQPVVETQPTQGTKDTAEDKPQVLPAEPVTTAGLPVLTGATGVGSAGITAEAPVVATANTQETPTGPRGTGGTRPAISPIGQGPTFVTGSAAGPGNVVLCVFNCGPGGEGKPLDLNVTQVAN